MYPSLQWTAQVAPSAYDVPQLIVLPFLNLNPPQDTEGTYRKTADTRGTPATATHEINRLETGFLLPYPLNRSGGGGGGGLVPHYTGTSTPCPATDVSMLVSIPLCAPDPRPITGGSKQAETGGNWVRNVRLTLPKGLAAKGNPNPPKKSLLIGLLRPLLRPSSQTWNQVGRHMAWGRARASKTDTQRGGHH